MRIEYTLSELTDMAANLRTLLENPESPHCTRVVTGVYDFHQQSIIRNALHDVNRQINAIIAEQKSDRFPTENVSTEITTEEFLKVHIWIATKIMDGK